MVLVSVIMPVYNTNRKLLCRAIQSILEQSLYNIELILIDDGSLNDAGEICDSYAKNDSRVVVVHQDNSGICSARNKALKIAKGRYIGFCDHDDEYGRQQLEDNYKLAEKNHADIVKFGYDYICLDNLPKFPFCKYRISDRYVILKDESLVQEYEKLKECGILTFVWDALYNKEFLQKHKILFDEQFRIGQEDIDFNNFTFLHAVTLVYNPQKYYKHYRYKKSTSRGMDKQKSNQLIVDEQEIFSREIQLCQKLLSKGMNNISINRVYYRNFLVILSTTMRVDFSGTKDEKISILKRLHNYFFALPITPLKISVINGLPNKICFFLFMKKKYNILISLASYYLKFIKLIK